MAKKLDVQNEREPKRQTRPTKRSLGGWWGSVRRQLRLLAVAFVLLLSGLLATVWIGLRKGEEASNRFAEETLPPTRSLQEMLRRLDDLQTQLLQYALDYEAMPDEQRKQLQLTTLTDLQNLTTQYRSTVLTQWQQYAQQYGQSELQSQYPEITDMLQQHLAGIVLFQYTLQYPPDAEEAPPVTLAQRMASQRLPGGIDRQYTREQRRQPLRLVVIPSYKNLTKKITALHDREVALGETKLKNTQLESFIWLSAIFAFLLIVAISITIPVINQRISNSIRRLNRVIRALAQGDLSRKKVPVRNDEFRDLARNVNNLSNSLSRIATFAEQIGNGKFDTELEKLGDNDQLGEALDQMRMRLQTVAEEDRKRNWTVVGLAQFSEIFRYSNDVQTLSERIISALSKYINANQGAFFVLEGEGEEAELRMVSSYAYTAGQGIKRGFRLGEGFVGQAAMEKESIYISDIPVDYVTLTSGLGEALPRCLLIVPLMYNEQVFGVIEFASFSNFEAFEIDFVKKLSESIGVALGNLRNQARTLTLLNESQKLSQELQEKQSALLQNTRTLEASQQQMVRTQQELKGQISAVNNAAIVSETDTEGNITFVNDRFISASGYSEEELLGKSHRMLRTEFLNDEEAARLWSTLKAGRVWRGEFRNRAKDGAIYWVEATLTPVLDEHQRPVKYISVQFDITKQKNQEEQIRTQLEVSMAQEEELRQNAEELEAQQEEMRRTQIELTGMISALNNSAIVSTADLQGRIISVNDQFLRASHYQREELIGQNHRLLKSGHQSDDIYDELWKTIIKGDVWKGEFKNKAKDNTYYWVTATITPVLDAQRKPVKYISVTFDVTAQKLQEEQIRAALEISQAQEAELRQNAEELQAAQDEMRKTQIELRGQIGAVNNAGIVAETDLKGNITLVNEEFCRVTGYAMDELLGKNHRMLRDNEHPEPFYEKLWDTITRGEVWVGIFKNRKKNEEPYWVKTTITPVLGFDGKPVKYIAVSFDITAQIAQQQQIEAQSIELEGQINALNNAALVTESDPQGIITFVNEEASRIWGYEKGELIGQPHSILKTEDSEHSPEYYAELWQTISSGQVWSSEIKNRAKNGEHFWEQLTITPVKDAEGNILKYIGVGFDITKNKRQATRIKTLFQESKEQEKRLRETQRELAGQISAINNAAIVSETDASGVITFVNDEATFVWGYSREELVGQHHRIIKGNEHPEKFYKRMWDKISQGHIWQGQVLNRAKNGSDFWVQLTITPVLGDDGMPVKYISVGFDITAQKEQSIRIKAALDQAEQQEAAYRAQIAQLQAGLPLTESTPATPATPAASTPSLLPTGRLNHGLTLEEANPALQALLGHPTLPTSLLSLLAPGQELTPEAVLYGIVRNGRSTDLLLLHTAGGSSGSIRVLATFLPITDESLTLIAVEMVLVPLDELTADRLHSGNGQAEEPLNDDNLMPPAIQETQVEMQTAATETKTQPGTMNYQLGTPASVRTDVVGKILEVDAQFTEQYGYTSDEAVGQNMSILRSQQVYSGYFFDMWSIIGRGKNWQGEILNRKKDGSEHWALLRITPIQGEEGNNIAYEAKLWDIEGQVPEFSKKHVLNQKVTDTEGNELSTIRRFKPLV